MLSNEIQKEKTSCVIPPGEMADISSWLFVSYSK